ncbi:hypothetical protein AB0I51_29185 [Streptomyces sp. NPDC050549]|uniref:hypothetical protein n=1 Tax=Streptomyces sp. NPDC050549 TaxID=3155406 RepID=UPI00342B65CC
MSGTCALPAWVVAMIAGAALDAWLAAHDDPDIPLLVLAVVVGARRGGVGAGVSMACSAVPAPSACLPRWRDCLE